jgi:hypothetical protein
MTKRQEELEESAREGNTYQEQRKSWQCLTEKSDYKPAAMLSS